MTSAKSDGILENAIIKTKAPPQIGNVKSKAQFTIRLKYLLIFSLPFRVVFYTYGQGLF